MRDPELVARAQRAAARLESAWGGGRALQGLGETPAQRVVGYVGYALNEPWGQPRAVIGFSADEAERLAGVILRRNRHHGDTDPRAARQGSRGTVPRQAPEPLGAPVLTVTPPLSTDVLAVTSQLSGSQLGPSFLPGSGARLSIASAGW